MPKNCWWNLIYSSFKFNQNKLQTKLLHTSPKRFFFALKATKAKHLAKSNTFNFALGAFAVIVDSLFPVHFQIWRQDPMKRFPQPVAPKDGEGWRFKPRDPSKPIDNRYLRTCFITLIFSWRLLAFLFVIISKKPRKKNVHWSAK